MIKNVPSTTVVDIRVFVTTEDSQSWDDDSAEGDAELKGGSNGSDPQLIKLPSVSLEQGRPNLENLINEEINRATGEISVNGGPLIQLINSWLT